MSYDKRRALAALSAFQKATGLKDFPWEKASGLGEGTLRRFRTGPNRSMSTETYEKLAAGATLKLGRTVTASEIRGEAPAGVEIPVQHYVGAGDEVHLVDDNSPIDYTEAPPGFEKGAAAIVRGESMRPTFDPGDMLFFRRREPPPPFKDLPLRPVIVQVGEGRLFVKKLLPGTRRGRYHLLSINPLTPVLQDQAVESIARIGWIKPAG